MSAITKTLLKEIEQLELKLFFKEEVCMMPVSKNLNGRIEQIDKDLQKCRQPACETLKAMHAIQLDAKTNRPCDSVAARTLDGLLSGKLLFAFIEEGKNRGYHIAKFDWSGASSKLVGRMSGIANAGTHRPPLMQCVQCYEHGHMEGRLDAVVVDGDHKGCRLLATYAIEFDPSSGSTSTIVTGALEGVLICDCK